MNIVDIDFLTAFFASIVFLVLHAVWYSPALFGKQWEKHHHFKKSEKNRGYDYFILFIVGYIVSVALAITLGFFEATSTLDGIYVGIGISISFIATSQLATLLKTKKSWTIFWIDNVYWFITLGVMGGILAA